MLTCHCMQSQALNEDPAVCGCDRDVAVLGSPQDTLPTVNSLLVRQTRREGQRERERERERYLDLYLNKLSVYKFSVK